MTETNSTANGGSNGTDKARVRENRSDIVSNGDGGDGGGRSHSRTRTAPPRTPSSKKSSIDVRQNRHVFYLVPTGPGTGLTSVSLGLVQALDRKGIDVGFFKPFSQPQEQPGTAFLRAVGNFNLDVLPDPLPYEEADAILNNHGNGGGESRLLQELVERFELYAMGKSVVIVEALQPQPEVPEHLNKLIAKALDAEIIIVSTLKSSPSSVGKNLDSYGNDSGNVNFANASSRNIGLGSGHDGYGNGNNGEGSTYQRPLSDGGLRRSLGGGIFHDLEERIQRLADQYGGLDDPSVLGCIINKFNAPTQHVSGERLDEAPPAAIDPFDVIMNKCSNLFRNDFWLIGVIPWDNKLLSPRTYDMAQHLGARVLYEGHLMTRRVDCVKIVARSVKNMVKTLRPNTLIVTPVDRDDIILAVSMAALNGVPLSGLLLTGDGESDDYNEGVIELCSNAFKTGLPLLVVQSDSYVTAAKAANIDQQVAIDDVKRIHKVMNSVAERIRLSSGLLGRCSLARQPRMSPAAFMYMLEGKAEEKPRKIVLPEGLDPRIIQAAVVCHERNIAQCVLLGEPEEVRRLASARGLELPDDMEILDPNLELRKKYLDPMVELRRHKGLTEPMALAQLEDVSVLGTMMLATGDVDGLVSGACHSTANTVRPALQLIKTRSDAKLISSIFFMLLPNQVCIYGDCAINPDPKAEELADIALQSAASAEAFGIEPRVAMLSYSTGTSGKGSDVDKVREATRIAQEKRPDLLIDGPLQFDAAVTPDVAKQKAPNSKVAGRATVLIFPDLNTGNTTYKAVQRTASIVAVGPMLQGLRRPVNDLSRGCLVDDIVYTIALTAIQANQAEGIEPATPLLAESAHKTFKDLTVS